METAVILKNILTLATDSKAAKRLEALLSLEAEASAAEEAVASCRAEFEQRQATARADLSKMAGGLAEYRDTVERTEGAAAEAEQRLLEDEEQWAGIGTPKECADRILSNRLH